MLGKLREFKKQYQLLLEFEIKMSSTFDEYIDYLKKNEKRERKKLAKINSNQIIKNLKFIQHSILKIIDMFDDDYLFNKTTLFINDEFERINFIKNNLNGYKDWHLIRKCFKNNMYLMAVILESHYTSHIKQEIINDIDNIQDSIGNWHDNIVSFEILSVFIKKNKTINPGKLNSYKKLICNL